MVQIVKNFVRNLATVTAGLYLGVIMLFVVGSILSPGFLKWSHVATILRQSAFLGLAAIGQTLVVLTAGIDLSIGALITAGNVLSAMIISGNQVMTFIAFLFVTVFGALIGAITGFGVAFLGISPLVMSLAVGAVVEGITLIISQGAPKGNASPLLQAIATGKFLGLPWVVWIWLIISLVIVIILRRTVFGREVYAVGANEEASRFSGINTKKVKILVYVISATGAALTGFLMTGYTQTAYLGIGTPYTLPSIAAVVIGGNDLMGGSGGYGGTFAGAMILRIIDSLLTTLAVPEAGKRIVAGGVILLLLFVHARRGQKTYKEV